MNYKAHIFFGIVFSIISIYIYYYFFHQIPSYDWKILLLFPVIAYIYSILPDCDHDNSKITIQFISIGTLLVLVGGIILLLKINTNYFLINNTLYVGIVFLVLTFICTKFTHHRGFIHSILAGLIFSFPLFFIHWFIFSIGFISYFSHLVMDGEIKII